MCVSLGLVRSFRIFVPQVHSNSATLRHVKRFNSSCHLTLTFHIAYFLLFPLCSFPQVDNMAGHLLSSLELGFGLSLLSAPLCFAGLAFVFPSLVLLGFCLPLGTVGFSGGSSSQLTFFIFQVLLLDWSGSGKDPGIWTGWLKIIGCSVFHISPPSFLPLLVLVHQYVPIYLYLTSPTI